MSRQSGYEMAGSTRVPLDARDWTRGSGILIAQSIEDMAALVDEKFPWNEEAGACKIERVPSYLSKLR